MVELVDGLPALRGQQLGHDGRLVLCSLDAAEGQDGRAAGRDRGEAVVSRFLADDVPQAGRGSAGEPWLTRLTRLTRRRRQEISPARRGYPVPRAMFSATDTSNTAPHLRRARAPPRRRRGRGRWRPCHLEAEVFDLMTKWIERYRREAEDRVRRLDALLERMGEQPATDTQAKEAAS
ncbi:hypothetical protein [Streptomyces chartreusis]|uniref:hypothetical protein n=1 Tax=Streptomyces chartreusis TaxID=1969 RepID=UPI00362EF860